MIVPPLAEIPPPDPIGHIDYWQRVQEAIASKDWPYIERLLRHPPLGMEPDPEQAQILAQSLRELLREEIRQVPNEALTRLRHFTAMALPEAIASGLDLPFLIGNALMQSKDLAAAKAQFQKIVAAHPEHVDAWYNLGYIANQKEEWSAAQGYFQRVVALRPDFEVSFNLAVIAIRLKQKTQAIGYLRQALAIQPDNARAKQLLEQLERQDDE